MASIQSLLGDEPPRDTVPELPRGIERASADSIFAVLGLPEKDVRGRTLGPATLGKFDLRDRQIDINPLRTEKRGNRIVQVFRGNEDQTSTLAHELAHQETTAGTIAPDIEGFMNLFFTQFNSLPADKRADILSAEFGQPVSESQAERITNLGRKSAEIDELMAEAIERGFGLARSANQDPEAAAKAKQANKGLPGILAAFNLFQRKFPEER